MLDIVGDDDAKEDQDEEGENEDLEEDECVGPYSPPTRLCLLCYRDPLLILRCRYIVEKILAHMLEPDVSHPDALPTLGCLR